MDSFPGGTPDKESLDAVVPDRPVFVTNRDGHGAWVNSRALELAGIDASTPDPADGRIERGAGGEPSGTLHEGAMRAVDELVPATTAAEWEQAILTRAGATACARNHRLAGRNRPPGDPDAPTGRWPNAGS